MEIFCFIGNVIQKAFYELQEVQMEADHWDAIKTCDTLKRCKSMTRCIGYMKSLKSKAEGMRDYELIETFDYAFDSCNARVGND